MVQEVQEVLVEAQEPHTKLLSCSCCKLMLPLDSFHNRNSPKAAKRLFRAHRCRGLHGVRNAGEATTKSRIKGADAAKAGALPGRVNARKTGAGKAAPRHVRANASAVKAVSIEATRNPGVWSEKAGRVAVHVKPACRVAATCPLKIYCTVEVKGLV